MAENQRVIIIAGPNGAGKTTFARVAQHVRQGGHGIPEAVIRRRFARLYAPRVDAWTLYDNSGEQPVLLDWSERT